MPKENSGNMKRNDKGGVESRPDYRGQINVAGTDYWLSGWIKDGDDGKWMSLSVQPKDAKPAAKPAAKPQPEDEDLPF